MRSLEKIVGDRMWPLGTKNCVRDVKITVSKSISHSTVLPMLTNRSTAVACGAVLRALRKEDGPARVSQASYGFIRTERYDTQVEHVGQVPITDKIDGNQYIDNTIDWVIKKVFDHEVSWRRLTFEGPLLIPSGRVTLWSQSTSSRGKLNTHSPLPGKSYWVQSIYTSLTTTTKTTTDSDIPRMKVHHQSTSVASKARS